VWQCLGMGESLRPIRRTECLVSFAADPKGPKYTPFQVAHSKLKAVDANSKQSIEVGKDKRVLKIGLLMIYKSNNDWPEALLQRVIRNRERYCDMHGCQIIIANHLLDKSRPAAWSKLKAAMHYLSDYDYLFYVDTDVVIMNLDVPPTAFINLAPQHDFIFSKDWNGINTGNWLVKNTEFSHWFLQKAWNQTQLIPKRSVDGVPHPFEYEQRAFHFLLNTDVWKSRSLPKYSGDSKALLSHFYILPQCSMNSYVLHPFGWQGDREESHFVQGDFLVHFAGKKGRRKTYLLSHYLDLADVQ
jgi:hypothetical protein